MRVATMGVGILIRPRPRDGRELSTLMHDHDDSFFRILFILLTAGLDLMQIDNIQSSQPM